MEDDVQWSSLSPAAKLVSRPYNHRWIPGIVDFLIPSGPHHIVAKCAVTMRGYAVVFNKFHPKV